jgi:hypothetical protein
MLLLTFKIIIIIIIAMISAYILRRFKPTGSFWRDSIALVCTAFMALASTELLNVVDKSFNKPSVKVIIQKATNEIVIDLKIKRSITLFSLSYPVEGLITNIQDLNSINDVYTSTARIIGDTAIDAVQNNLEISIKDIRPNVHISYKTIYIPGKLKPFIAGTDKYQYSYVWEYKGEKIYENFWKNVVNNSKASAPNLKVRAVKIYDKALTPEEVKKIYEEGPPIRK